MERVGCERGDRHGEDAVVALCGKFCRKARPSDGGRRLEILAKLTSHRLTSSETCDTHTHCARVHGAHQAALGQKRSRHCPAPEAPLASGDRWSLCCQKTLDTERYFLPTVGLFLGPSWRPLLKSRIFRVAFHSGWRQRHSAGQGQEGEDGGLKSRRERWRVVVQMSPDFSTVPCHRTKKCARLFITS